MDLTVYFGNLKTSRVVQEDVAELMRESFERFQTYIRCVNMTFTDVNGPRGGVDKQCRCVLQLKRMAPIVIEDRDSSFVSLVNRVASRASLTLSQRVDRKQSSYRSRRRTVRVDEESLSNALVTEGIESSVG